MSNLSVVRTGLSYTLGDFTFWITLSLSPKTKMTLSFGLSPKFGLAERKLVLK